jgi:PAS domain S-box-containing protein
MHANGARAVVTTDGTVWTANEAFCELLGVDESGLRRTDWRRFVHAGDRTYLAAHLVEVLAGEDARREFDVRLVPPGGGELPAHLSVELARGGRGRHGWFLLEATAAT